MKGIVVALAAVGAMCLAPVLLMALGIFFIPVICALVLLSPAIVGYLVGKFAKRKEDKKAE